MQEEPKNQATPQHISISMEKPPNPYQKILAGYLELWKSKPLIALPTTLGAVAIGIVGGNYMLKEKAIKKEPVVSINTGNEDPFGDTRNPVLESIHSQIEEYPDAVLFSIEKNEIYPFAKTWDIPENEFDVTSEEFRVFRQRASSSNDCQQLDVGKITVNKPSLMTACPIHSKRGKLLGMAAAKDRAMAIQLRINTKALVLTVLQ